MKKYRILVAYHVSKEVDVFADSEGHAEKKGYEWINNHTDYGVFNEEVDVIKELEL